MTQVESLRVAAICLFRFNFLFHVVTMLCLRSRLGLGSKTAWLDLEKEF